MTLFFTDPVGQEVTDALSHLRLWCRIRIFSGTANDSVEETAKPPAA